MVRLSREKSRAQTRERLLDSARQIFARKGYGGAAVDEIAENANYSKGAFYSNFDSKEAIFLELLRQHMEFEVAELRSLLDSNRGMDELVAAISDRYQKLNDDIDWCLLSIEFQLQAGRSATFASQFAELYSNQRRAIGHLLEVLFEKAGTQMPYKSEELAAGFIAMEQGLALQRAAREEEISQQAVGQIVKLFLEALIHQQSTI